MLDNREIRIQESIHTILRAALLALVQLAASDSSSNAFLPADVRKVVNRLLYSRLLALIHDELLQLLSILWRELREINILIEGGAW